MLGTTALIPSNESQTFRGYAFFYGFTPYCYKNVGADEETSEIYCIKDFLSHSQGRVMSSLQAWAGFGKRF